VYNIGGGTELTNVELTGALLECCGAGWDMVEWVADRKGHDRRYSLDDSALRAMGYAPRIPFAEGLPATVGWYRDNRPWWEPLTRGNPPAQGPAGTGRGPAGTPQSPAGTPQGLAGAAASPGGPGR
jgi:dTDP-glucose 4,6-dehydratase